MNKTRIYVASGWFTEATDKSLTDIETLLREHAGIKPYFPRHDGVKLSANEFHDHELRKKVFIDNATHINDSDYLVVNLDGTDGFYDTGTCWEYGYAMSKGIPVIIYDPTDTVTNRFKSLSSGFYEVCTDLDTLNKVLDNIVLLSHNNINSSEISNPGKLLFVAPDSTEEQMSINEDILATVILESHGSNFRIMTDFSHQNVYENIDSVFKDVDYMVAVIDDRHPLVSWMMGQAFERGIPVISYTNFDYGVNIMLACSILTHCKGKDELRSTIQRIKREGLNSFNEYDTSAIKAY